MTPPKVQAEPHWQVFDLPFSIGSGRNFFPDQNGHVALRMAFFESTKDHSLQGKVWFGSGIEGPPMHVHGGVSSYVLDEAMGSACWLARYPCVAKKISFEFKKMTPVGKDLNVEAMVVQKNQTTLILKSRIFDDKYVYTSGHGEFHRLERSRVEKFLEESPYQLDLDTLIFPK